ncbi:MAG: uracil-DNA glycosylase [Tenericutes bacterium]|nr:uracil-DNA glycosylase [Mycoplasmatota bacterium]
MIGNDWDIILKDEISKQYFINLLNFIKKEYQTKTIYPKQTEIFKAFRNTSYKDTKVVILGQDPYHGEGQAEGLSFSVKLGIQKPPSLQNIFKELHDDLGYSIPKNGSLVSWTEEGVLLLNTVLTVEASKPASHKDLGWETFTDAVIKKLNEKETPIVFILWGSFARSKKKLITNPIHGIVESPHPSPFSAYNGFFGSKPFSKTNNFLVSKGLKPINWEIK